MAHRRRARSGVRRLPGRRAAWRAARRASLERPRLGAARTTVLRGARRPEAPARACRSLSRGMSAKLPVWVLVVIHAGEREVLLLERRQHAGYWQSVTGSLDAM